MSLVTTDESTIDENDLFSVDDRFVSTIFGVADIDRLDGFVADSKFVDIRTIQDCAGLLTQLGVLDGPSA